MIDVGFGTSHSLVRGNPMMTEQELNNLINDGPAKPAIPSIVREMRRLSRALENQARDLASLYAAMSANGETSAQD